MTLTALGIIIAAYLIGSIPIGYIVGRLASGTDIRTDGSGNIGFSNVYRTVGPLPGVLVLIGDIGKGAIAVAIARQWGGGSEWLPVLAGFAAVAGHSWTVFLGFRGGKGVATAAGVLLSLVPFEALICVLIFLVVVFLGRMISLGSIVAACTLPIVVALSGHWREETIRVPLLVFSLALAALVIWRHRSNMARIAAGTENRFSFRGGGGS